jgi:hypothetical protein
MIRYWVVLALLATTAGCLPFAIPPLDIEASAGPAIGDLDAAATAASDTPTIPDGSTPSSFAVMHQVRLGSSPLEGFPVFQARRFDVSGGLILREAFGNYNNNGWYGQASFYPWPAPPKKGKPTQDPYTGSMIPAAKPVITYPRARAGIHLSGDVLSFSGFDEIGGTLAFSLELVSHSNVGRLQGCKANIGVSGESAIALKLSTGYRDIAGARYWYSTLGLSYRVPSVGGFFMLPSFCQN